MKKFTKVCLIIAAVCAGFGVVFCGIGAVLGASFSSVKELADEGELDVGNWHIGEGIYYNASEGDEGEYDRNVSQNFPAEGIKKLKFDLDAADICLESSDSAQEYEVTLNCGYKKYFSCEQDGDTLVVTYDRKNKMINSNVSITVVVPKTERLEALTIDSGAGDVEFTGDSFQIKKVTLDTGAGDVTAVGLDISELFDIDCGAGDVEISQSTFQDVSIDCGAGDFELYGEVKGDIDLSTGAGEANLILKGKESDFNYDLSVGVGGIEIDGRKSDGLSSSKKIENENATKTITVDSGVGEVEISFWN